MSNVSIFEKKWLDLVFEGKNQQYGAYKLRQESSKTTLFALLFGSVFLLGGTFLLSSFNSVSTPTPVDPFEGTIIKVDRFNPPKNEPKTKEPIAKSNPIETKKDNKNYVVSETEKAQPDIPVTDNHPVANTTPTDGGGGTGTPTNTIGTGGGGTSELPKIANDGVKKTTELDRQPAFPNGMKGFYEYVANNFEKEEIENGTSIRVFVSFVIEKNGTMSDIKILNKTNADVDKEAVRVLKSLKTKWTPGYKDGEPVRTQFTLPISIKSE